MKLRNGSLVEQLHEEFGYVAIGTDDELFIGEKLPHMTNQGEDFSTSAEVTGTTTYEDYEEQAEWAGYGETCRDCWAHYFKVNLIRGEVAK